MMMVLAAGCLSVGVAAAQTAANLTIVSGDGQVICQQCTTGVPTFYAPMTVQATTATGAPAPDVPITWAVSSGQGVFLQSGTSTFSTTTDGNGNATATLQLFLIGQSGSPITSVVSTTVTASTGNLAVTFYELQALLDQFTTSLVPPITATTSLVPGQTFSGQVGSSDSNDTITVTVQSQSGSPVANVAVFLVDAEVNSGSPTVACAGTPGAGPGVVLTNSNGVATCTPVYGGTPGSGVFWLDVGGVQAAAAQSMPPNFPASFYYIFPATYYNYATGVIGGYGYTVTPGTPGSISVVSGSNQSANPGQTLSQPLVAQVTNGSGQPLSGVTVNWTVSPANAASLAATTISGSNGQATNTVTLSSSASGTVTVTATAAGATNTAVFTISVTPPVIITSFQIVSGNNQTAVVGSMFAQPLVVQVTTSGSTVAGIPVTFQVQSGPVTLSSPSALTNGSGQALVTAQAGSFTGPAVVVASVSGSSGGSTQTFNLTVVAQGLSVTAANFYNGADLQPGSLSPCGLGQLIASNLGIPNTALTFLGLPAPQNNITITFNSISAPILDIGTNALGQQFVLFQVPCTLSPATGMPVVVNINGSTSNINLNVQAASPGLFRTPAAGNISIPVLVRPDGSYVSLANPARRGETEVAYVTGLGATSPSMGTSSVPVPGGPPAMVLGTVIPGMSGGGLPLVYAQLSEDLPGVYVVAFQIPSTEAQGNEVFSIGIIPAGGSTAYYSAPAIVPVQ